MLLLLLRVVADLVLVLLVVQVLLVLTVEQIAVVQTDLLSNLKLYTFRRLLKTVYEEAHYQSNRNFV
jgi:hypothetical protein